MYNLSFQNTYKAFYIWLWMSICWSWDYSGLISALGMSIDINESDFSENRRIAPLCLLLSFDVFFPCILINTYLFSCPLQMHTDIYDDQDIFTAIPQTRILILYGLKRLYQQCKAFMKRFHKHFIFANLNFVKNALPHLNGLNILFHSKGQTLHLLHDQICTIYRVLLNCVC